MYVIQIDVQRNTPTTTKLPTKYRPSPGKAVSPWAPTRPRPRLGGAGWGMGWGFGPENLCGGCFALGIDPGHQY